MPLYMDYHKHVLASFDDIVSAHLLDLEVQAKFGVRYLKWWMNPNEGVIFCLMEGPDARACENVHHYSHGITACSIIEVDPASVNIFMGDVSRTKHDAVLTPEGSIDAGYRVILILEQDTWTPRGKPQEVARMKNRALSMFGRHYGRPVPLPDEEKMFIVFNSANDAVQCALDICDDQPSAESFRIAIVAGQPVTEQDGFFSEALNLGRAMINLCRPGQIIGSTLAGKLAADRTSKVRFLHRDEEELLARLTKLIDDSLSNEHFNVDQLTTRVGMSRAQLYRKVTALSGRSPNDFIRTLRMNKARELLRSRANNISQIALAVGYNNPSYFARSFRETFGFAPHDFMAQHLKERNAASEQNV